MHSVARDASPWRDALVLVLVALVLVGAGLGLRDPWPADEPRFASLARDMVASGDWLFPRVGGDLYQDKPPLYFWLLAGAWALFGGFRGWFLLPSLIAAAGTLLLVYDLGRRLSGPQAGLLSAITLASTLQFLLAMRGAQIDGTLCLVTTLALYGLLRHALLGPAWGWYAVGGLAAGLGVITKGVGFLPILVLLPAAWMRRRGWVGLAPHGQGGLRWVLAPVALLAGICVWFVPMMIAVALRGSPEVIAYRDEILFQQTLTRYAGAWHHAAPWHYFFTEVIPPLWLPWSVLLFWLVPQWRAAWRARDARVWLPLAWVLIVIFFFTLSAGKRGVYLLPALPALALAAASGLPELYARRGVGRTSLALGALLVLGGMAVLLGLALDLERVRRMLVDAGITSVAPAIAFVTAAILCWAVAARWRPVLAWPLVLACLVIAWGCGVAPQIDARRSGGEFMARVLAAVPRDLTLGLVAYKEQFLLHLDRPVVNFGHRRWREGHQEAYDAAAWLVADPGRMLLLPQSLRSPCFAGTAAVSVERAGRTAREDWLLVRGRPLLACVRRGDPRRAIAYSPPARRSVGGAGAVLMLHHGKRLGTSGLGCFPRLM